MIDAALYLLEGEYGEAVFAGVAAIPIIEYLARGVQWSRLGKTLIKPLSNEIGAIGDLSKIAPKGESFLNKARNTYNRLLGKEYPTKLNLGRKAQPYDPKTGRFLSYIVNPGLKLSPITRFSSGFTQGWAETKGAVGATPVGRAGNVGYMLGNIIGHLL